MFKLKTLGKVVFRDLNEGNILEIIVHTKDMSPTFVARSLREYILLFRSPGNFINNPTKRAKMLLSMKCLDGNQNTLCEKRATNLPQYCTYHYKNQKQLERASILE